MKVTVKRLNAARYSVLTDVPMSDGTYQSDAWMELVNGGRTLKSAKGVGLRVGGALRVELGPVSAPLVQALGVGQEVTL